MRLGYIHGEDYSPEPAGVTPSRVLKSHNFHAHFAEVLGAGRAVALYAYRDLRDVAFSLMHKWQLDFDAIVAPGGLLRLCLENDRAWRATPGVLIQRYEDLVAEPVAGIRAIADHVGVGLEAGEAAALARDNSLRANRSRTAALVDRLRDEGMDLDDPINRLACDPVTLLHWNHLRDGRVGDWRGRATPDQVAVLASLCGDWLVEHGYEPDSAWAGPGSPR